VYVPLLVSLDFTVLPHFLISFNIGCPNSVETSLNALRSSNSIGTASFELRSPPFSTNSAAAILANSRRLTLTLNSSLSFYRMGFFCFAMFKAESRFMISHSLTSRFLTELVGHFCPFFKPLATCQYHRWRHKKEALSMNHRAGGLSDYSLGTCFQPEVVEYTASQPDRS